MKKLQKIKPKIYSLRTVWHTPVFLATQRSILSTISCKPKVCQFAAVWWEVRNAGRAPEWAWKHISDLIFLVTFFIKKKSDKKLGSKRNLIWVNKPHLSIHILGNL